MLTDALMDCRLTNLQFDSFIGAAACYLNMGFSTHVENITLTNSGTVNENDILFRSQVQLTATDIKSRSASGFGPGMGMCAYSNFSYVSAYKAFYRGIKFGSCLYCSGSHLEGHDSGSTGIGITWGSKYNQFTNLKAMRNRGGTGGNDVGIWFSDDGNNDNVLVNVLALDNQTVDIAVFTNDTGNVIRCARYGTLTNLGGATVSTT